tara:strand:- start:78 stop:1634 length:1557 start_codon:yes stop_codon:yes gene_type:complete
MLKKILLVLLVLAIIVTVFLYRNIADRHPGYTVDININPKMQPGNIRVGFGKVPITPEIYDTWNDINENAKYEPEKGDTYNDLNGNGEFDPVWIAGFHHIRPAQGIHDDIWARVIVLDDGQTRIAIVGLDVVGFLHDDIVDIRKALPGYLDIDYTIICSTHNHEGPDLVGIWGESIFKSGVDPEYMEFVKKQTVTAIARAVENMRQAKLKFAQNLKDGANFVMDTRKPQEMDHGIRVIQAIDVETDTTLGSLISWGNHPETLWSRNLLISSDFPHYIREAVENGIQKENQGLAKGIGGTAVYISSSVGGLMTTRPDFSIPDPFTGAQLTGATFEKAEAQGQQIGLLILNALNNHDAVEIEKASFKLRAKTISIPLDNNNFRLGFALGVIKHGTIGWMNVRTEVSAFQIGPASFITIPGEIYPEIVNGGVVSPPGQDFAIAPLEVPPLRSFMQGQFKFVLGLANDEIGYIIPKSEWDEKPPYLYNDDESPYGEENSTGPEAAPIIYNSIIELLNSLSNE